MAKVNPEASKLIDDYIATLPDFSKEICLVLRECFHKADSSIIEDWKWRIPIFSKTSLICGFSGFKKHVSLTFFKGAQMSNQHLLFTDDCNAQKTRTIKFSNLSEINKTQIVDYFKEAALLDEVKIKNETSKKKDLEIPELLQNALEKNPLAKSNFNKMAYTYRKEYAQHIANAKRETTKLKRLEKVIANLEQNIKMHEQYNC